MAVTTEPGLNPHHVADGYREIFKSVYGLEPHVHYLNNQWYHVNGEIVHRATLLSETQQLTELLHKKRVAAARAAKHSMIKRLIARVRAL